MKAPLVPLLQGGAACLLLLFALPLFLPGASSIGWWGMQSLPLLLVLLQLHRPVPRPLQWLGFLVLFYFTVGVLQLFSPDLGQRWLGGLTVACCCLLFPLAIVRLRVLRHDKE